MTSESKSGFFPLAIRAVLGFAAAVGIVHLIMGIGLIIAMGMPPLTWFAARSILYELGVAILVGAVVSPVLLLRRGRWIFPLLMTAIWIGLELWVAVDTTKPQMWLVPSLVALGLYGLGSRVGGKRPGVVIAVAVVIPVVALIIPVIKDKTSPGVQGTTESTATATAPPDAPDVLFIVMDTVRARSVSAYGYERETTPHFDRLAREGLFFHNATAPGTWSLAAHASIFTGSFPSVHHGHAETRYLDGTFPTLAETMAEAGWETYCFTANPFISDSFGLTRGFQFNDQAWITGAGGRGFSFIYRLLDALGLSSGDKGGGTVIGNLQRWMADRPADAPPAFVFVNFLEAHFPFHQLPPEFRNAFTDMPVSELRDIGQIAFGVQFGRQLTEREMQRVHQPIKDMYDGGVLYTDHLMNQVVDLWRERGTLDETILIVLGDHGELVGEHGAFGHMPPMYEEALHVPFILRYPPAIEPGSQVEPAISTVGTFATIMDLLDLPVPDTVQVGSLLPALEGRPAGQPALAERYEEEMLAARFGEGEANGEGPLLSPRGRYRTYRQDDLKLAVHYEEGEFGTWLFDLAQDPGEMVDISETRVEDYQRMMQELQTWEAALGLSPLDAEGRGTEGAPEVDDAAMEQLKALGYVE